MIAITRLLGEIGVRPYEIRHIINDLKTIAGA